ncbi:MAG: UDP-2,3-diacylglucosamine hydrolase, partial [Gammaproteobacteria bacterium]|nr:UDP-2,3-diacylglucosamine hydrolase [Gammaproteobacteria bacterium]
MQKILSGLAALLLVGAASAQPASLLVYRVAEQGGEPYISRIIVTPDFLRLDEGSDDASYTLFDRRQEILYNVSPDDHSILVLDVTEPVPGDKAGLNLQEQVDVDEQAPLVAGQRPTHVRLLANGDLCSELVVIKDTMNDAVAALSEMKTALARVQAATLNAMPLDRRTP